MKVRADHLWAGISFALATVCATDALERGRADAVLFFALHAQAAVLFCRRMAPAATLTGVRAWLIPIVGMTYPYAFDTSYWTALGHGLVLAGCVRCFAASAALGPSYAVLPALRRVQVRGPYQVVRHPIYASYLLMDAGILINTPTGWNALVLGIGICCYLWRVTREEQLLSASPAYAMYQADVRFRLLPGVF